MRTLLGSLLLFVGLLASIHSVQARLVGTNPGTDIECHGGTPNQAANELCHDASGNFIPTTTNTQALGASSLVFSGLYLGSTGLVNSTGGLGLAVKTTDQIILRVDPIGTEFLIQERVNGALVSNAYNKCVSTAAAVASYVYLSVSTQALAIAGQACNK